MLKNKLISAALVGSLSMPVLFTTTGCENLPGEKSTQGAVIGGVGGAAAGAALSKDNRILGALLGGALGAGGGYLIGSQVEKADSNQRDDAIKASTNAQRNPATPADVRNANTADLNNDGFVTMDEVVAMQKADLSDNEMIRRLQDTGQFFELTPQQQDYLRGQGVDDRVINAMLNMNRDQYRQAQERIGGSGSGNYRNDRSYNNNSDYDRNSR